MDLEGWGSFNYSLGERQQRELVLNPESLWEEEDREGEER